MIRPLLLPTVLLALIGCSREPTPAPPVVRGFAPVALGDKPGIQNLFRLNDNLYSGSGPEGAAGFATLKDLGIRTVITVDGAAPEIEEARKFGLRYVHLPIGYDGVPRKRAVQIAEALRELPGPIYVHCHHGRHRGPAAAVAGLRADGAPCTDEQAAAYLNSAGTDPHYAGLYASVEQMTPAGPKERAEVAGDFPELARIDDIAKSMVRIDETWDRLKAIRAAGWKSPSNNPDLLPASEALQLLEHFKEVQRLPDTAKRPEDFRAALNSAITNAGALERALREKGDAEAAFKASASDCAKCHAVHRDRKGG